MKGIIFKHFESFVCDSFGPETFEAVLESTTLETQGVFLGPGSYPDSDLFALVATAVGMLGVPVNDAVYAFGVYLFGKLLQGHTEYAEGHDLRSFVASVHSVIHVEVRKLYPGAELPEFRHQIDSDGNMRLEYRSVRKLCALFRGLLDGAAAHFEEVVSAEELRCMHDGAECCEFDIRFESGTNRMVG